MDRNLEMIESGAAHHILERDIAGNPQPGAAGTIRIGCLERSSTGSQRAIGIELYSIQPQAVVIEPRSRPRPSDECHLLDPGRVGHDPDLQRSDIARAAIGLPVLDRSAHIGRRRHAAREQQFLRLAQRKVYILRAGRGYCLCDQISGRIDQHARRLTGSLADRRQPLDLSASRRLGQRSDTRQRECAAVGPAGMPINPVEPDRAITHYSVEFCGSREPAPPCLITKSPQLLIPAAPDDPRAIGVCGGIGGNFPQRFIKRLRFRQVERERGKADARDMDMGINQSGHQDPVFALDQVIDLGGPLVAAAIDLLDPAIIADQQPGKMFDLTLGIQRHTIDIIDQRIGHGRAS